MKAHFGSRGGSEAMEHFESMINTGRMDGPTLIAALEGVRPYMKEYARLGTINTSSGKNPVPPPSHTTKSGRKVGDLVTLKGGKQAKITAVYPDGSFEVE